MLTGIIGAAVGYIILTSLLAWLVILSRGRTVLKVCAVAFSIYYAMGLYSLLHDIEGWPSSQDIPAGSNVISIRIQEPSGSDLGAIYIWCSINPDNKKAAISALRPSSMLSYVGGKQPRAFKMPYDREMHKRIAEAQKNAKKNGGWIKIESLKGERGDGGQGEKQSNQIGFKVINPMSILTKEGASAPKIRNKGN